MVEQIFTWRVTERAGYEQIAARLNADPGRYPPPQARNAAGVWTKAAIQAILANPKYTGYMVYGRTDKKGRPRPPEAWIWSPGPVHPELVPRQIWEQAQQVTGRPRSRTGDGPNPHPATTRTYTLRGYIRCAICGRLQKGVMRGTGSQYVYYLCPLNPRDPRTAGRHPGHPPTVMIGERPMLDAIGGAPG